MIKEVKNNVKIDPRNLTNPAETLDAFHFQNFFAGIRQGSPLNSDIVGGHQSTLLCQLGNIALRSGNTLHIDPTNGHIRNDAAAERFWKREYQPGWAPTI